MTSDTTSSRHSQSSRSPSRADATTAATKTTATDNGLGATIAVLVPEPDDRVFSDPFFAGNLRGIDRVLSARDVLAIIDK